MDSLLSTGPTPSSFNIIPSVPHYMVQSFTCSGDIFITLIDRVQLQWPPCISAIHCTFFLQLFEQLEDEHCTCTQNMRKCPTFTPCALSSVVTHNPTLVIFCPGAILQFLKWCGDVELVQEGSIANGATTPPSFQQGSSSTIGAWRRCKDIFTKDQCLMNHYIK